MTKIDWKRKLSSRKLWSKAMVKTAVKKGVITQAQYEEITGEKH